MKTWLSCLVLCFWWLCLFYILSTSLKQSISTRGSCTRPGQLSSCSHSHMHRTIARQCIFPGYFGIYCSRALLPLILLCLAFCLHLLPDDPAQPSRLLETLTHISVTTYCSILSSILKLELAVFYF